MKNVLVTGATSGIGFEIAKIFYEKGYSLIITSSNTDNLNKTKNRLYKENPIHIFTQDFSKSNAAEELYKSIKDSGLQIDILINNAGIGFVRNDTDISIEDTEKMININIINLVKLTKLYLKEMKERDYGMILNVSSIGAFQPGPYTSAYYASKAFVLNYTLGLKQELCNNNIHISVLCPGSTATNFFSKAGQDTPKLSMNPRKVAIYAYHGLKKNRDIIIPGFSNKLTRLFPTWIKSYAIKQMKKSF